jgi:hypothetical protein
MRNGTTFFNRVEAFELHFLSHQGGDAVVAWQVSFL